MNGRSSIPGRSRGERVFHESHPLPLTEVGENVSPPHEAIPAKSLENYGISHDFQQGQSASNIELGQSNSGPTIPSPAEKFEDKMLWSKKVREHF